MNIYGAVHTWQNVKKIKGAAHKNGNFNGAYKQDFKV